MLKNNFFNICYEIKEFCFKAITHNNYKNYVKPPKDLIIESFILKKNLVVNCIQTRTNIHDNVIDVLKRNIVSLTYQKLKIAVLTTVTDDNYFKKYKDVFYIKKNYCQYHNYDFIFNIIGEDTYDMGKGWLKLYKLRENLQNYDYIFVSDADVIITNRDIRIEDIILKYFNKDTFLYLTTDYNSINTGNSIWKNCEKSFKFLDEIFKIKTNPIRNSIDTPYIPFGIYEQPTIIYLINSNKKFRDFIKILPQFVLNSYIDLTPTLKQKNIIPVINKIQNRTNWKPGDFLIHLAGFNYIDNIIYNFNLIIKKYILFYKKLIIQKEDLDYGSIM